MAKDEGSSDDQMTTQRSLRVLRHSGFVIPSSLGLRQSLFQSGVVATNTELAELVRKIGAAKRVAVDTEADSLHSYREKLCLLQISVPAVAGIVDAGPDLGSASANRDHRSRLQSLSCMAPTMICECSGAA